MKRILYSLLVGFVITLLVASVWDSNTRAGALQSPLVTPTAQPDPPTDPIPGPGGGLDFPDVDFNPTILLVIAGLVQMSKQLGVNGKGSLVTSMVLGLLLGGGDFLASNGTPSDFAGWFGVLIVGLAYGLSTSGLYLLAKQRRSGMVS